MYAIELLGVTKTFGKHTAVDNLELVVPTGTVFGFIGPNGSGKTTTLRLILRIFYPDRGTVRVLGSDHSDAADDRLGYLPEERGLYKKMRVRELLRFYAELKDHVNCRADIDSWLRRLQLDKWGDKTVDTLSKGMAQKVQFISAVIARPQLVILDEPFSGLDPVNMEVLKDAIMELKKNGTTVIFSTHDMDIAERMCDHIFMIFRGKKVLDGTLASIQAQYGQDTIRVRAAATNGALEGLPGVVRVNDYGRYQELRMEPGADPQAILKQLAGRTAVERFEITQPSLHDIFIRIAGPDAARPTDPNLPIQDTPAVRKILVIAKCEYLATVRTKAFLVSIILMPILMGGGIFAQRLLRGVVDIADKKIVVIDRTGKLLPRLIEAARDHNDGGEVFDSETHKQIGAKYVIEPGPDRDLNDEDRLALSQRVKDRKIFAFVEIPANVVQPSKNAFDFIKKQLKGALELTAKGGPGADQINLCSENATQFELTRWLQRTLNKLIGTERLKIAKINPDLVTYATLGVNVESMGLYTKASDGQIKKAEPSNREAAIFVPMGIMMLMFMVIMVAAQPLMTSVLEEKSLRIAEVLLGSASPFQIMMGKLIGNVGVSLTMITIYMAGGVYLLRYYDMPDLLTRDIIIWFVIYQVLAIFIYGSVFVAIGAACNDIKEAQSYLTPVMLTLVFPMMVWFQVLRDPMGKFATWISLFPPCTPMLMVMRMASTKTLPIWQPILGVVLVAIAVTICVFAAGRIFRIGLLSQGKAPKPAELIRWIISG